MEGCLLSIYIIIGENDGNERLRPSSRPKCVLEYDIIMCAHVKMGICMREHLHVHVCACGRMSAHRVVG
jgi:hypothetical protein